MSLISSLLLLFLLCLPMHECNVRRLGVVNKEHENKFHLSGKNEETATAHVHHKLNPSLSKEHRTVGNEERAMEESEPINMTQKAKDSKANMKGSKDQNAKISGAVNVQKESLVSVSWHVPHEKHGESQPGFNLDYSPPKTHPPSHN